MYTFYVTHGIKRSYLVLFLIIIIAASLRLYRLADMASFDFDQEYAANFAYSVVKVFPIQLIGQESSIPGLYLGPLYFYYLTPFFVATNLHPIGGYLGTILLGILTIAAYYLVGASLFGKTAGLIAAFLRAILVTKLEIAWSMVPAYSIGLPILITWFCFYKYWQGDLRWLPLLALVFGAYTSIHPILFPFYLVFAALVVIKKKLPNLKITVLSVVAFIIPNLSLIIFEFLHNFLEIQRVFALFGSSSGFNPTTRFFSYLGDTTNDIQNILSFDYLPLWLVTALFLLIIAVLVIKKVDFWKYSFHKITLLLTFLIFYSYYTLFPTHIPEYYLKALASLILLYTSACLALLLKNRVARVFSVLILLNIVVVNFSGLKQRWDNPSLITLAHKDYIVKEILKRQPQDQNFYVSYIKEPGWNFGFDYLFKLYGHQPQIKEVKPPIYTIVIPKTLSPGAIDVSSGNIGLILPDEMKNHK